MKPLGGHQSCTTGIHNLLTFIFAEPKKKSADKQLAAEALELITEMDKMKQVGRVVLRYLHSNILLHYKSLWYGGGNSTTAEEVSRLQGLDPNPNWLVWKGIPTTKNSLQLSLG